MRPGEIDDSRTADGKSLVIGVTGGVGAGKSRILKLLEEEYGAQVLLADQVAAQLEEPGQEGHRLLVERFGTEILEKSGRLNRKAFADRIFKDPEALREVNRLIHPLTWQALCEKVERLCRDREGRPTLIAVEAALFDEKTKQLCDTLWYVDVPENVRFQRLMENRGYSLEKCLDIVKNQPDRESFLALADVVIDNNKTMEEVREQIARLLTELLEK